jgi:flagellar hook-associated protein 3 FlgL
MSENEDVDMAETIMNLQNEENVYRASLSGGARIIQPSLVDFLK